MSHVAICSRTWEPSSSKPMEIRQKSPLEHDDSLARQDFWEHLEAPGSPLAFYLFNLALVTSEPGVRSIEIEGLLLADTWIPLNNRGNKTCSAMEGIHGGYSPDCYQLQNKLCNFWCKNHPYAKSLKITHIWFFVFKEICLKHVVIHWTPNSFSISLVLQLVP